MALGFKVNAKRSIKMDTLLLAFFDPRKFVSLLGQEAEIRKRIKLGDEDIGLRYNNEEVIYLMAGKHPWVGDFDAEVANKVLAVMIPDGHKDIDGYAPNKPFKILHHTTGTVQNLRKDLLTHKLIRAVAQEPEDRYTKYDKLAEAIVVAEKGGSLDEYVKAVYEAIEEPDYALEAKLFLLHMILNEDGVSLAGVIKILADDEPDKVRRTFDIVFRKYPLFGDKLLKGRESHLGEEVTLEDKLNILKQGFITLGQDNLDNVFSTEYQIAFDRLREALDIG
jgi:hypothetical protein